MREEKIMKIHSDVEHIATEIQSTPVAAAAAVQNDMEKCILNWLQQKKTYVPKKVEFFLSLFM